MGDIKSINLELPKTSDEMEELIVELIEREEFACTLDGCGGHACGIN